MLWFANAAKQPQILASRFFLFLLFADIEEKLPTNQQKTAAGCMPAAGPIALIAQFQPGADELRDVLKCFRFDEV